MSRFAQDDILDMSISERIQLVEDLWDSIAKVPESIQLSEEQKLELDRRLDAYHSSPTWDRPGRSFVNGSGAASDAPTR